MVAPLVWLLLQLSALPPGDAGTAEVVLPVPERDWAVRFAPQDFEFGEPLASSDGATIGVAGDGPRGIAATLTLRASVAAETTEACRAEADDRAGRSAKRTYRFDHDQRGPLALSTYVVAFYRGAAVDQRHVHAFLYRDGYCIELELSMPRFKRRHQHLLDDAVDTFEVVDL